MENVYKVKGINGYEWRLGSGLTRTTVEQFKAAVRTVNPDMEFWAVLGDGQIDYDLGRTVCSNFYTSTARQNNLNNLKALLTSAEWDGCWDGIVDDQENYRYRCPTCGFTGTKVAGTDYTIKCPKGHTWASYSVRPYKYAYWELVFNDLNAITPYYPYEGGECIGQYDAKYTWTGHNLAGDDDTASTWKSNWDEIEDNTKEYYGTRGKYAITLISGWAFLPHQLPWLDDKLGEKAWPYLDCVSLWHYRPMIQADWAAWFEFVKSAPTATHSATPTPAPTPTGDSSNLALLTNGDFETGSVSPWRMYIGGSGNKATLTLTGDAYSGKYAGKIAVTSCNSPYPNGYIAFNSPMLKPTSGQTYTMTFTYKASSLFEAYFLCQTSNTQVYNKRITCYASSSWKTVTFEVGPIPSATDNWFTLRFNTLNTVTVDNISIYKAGSSNPTPTSTPISTATKIPTPTPSPTLPSNLIGNGDFESGTAGWSLYLVKNIAKLTTTMDGTMSGMMTVTSYTAKEPYGYVCLQHHFTPKADAIYKVSFTYKSTANFNAFILCQGGSASFSKVVSCQASSQWKTVSFATTALPFAADNWIDFRFYSIGTLMLDNVSVMEQS